MWDSADEKQAKWALKIQNIAVSKIYEKITQWKNTRIEHQDTGWAKNNELMKILDVAGADKIIRWPNGTAAFLGQRFRSFNDTKYDDFTIRYMKIYGSNTEYTRLIHAFDNSGFIAQFYAYGHVNKNEDGFTRFRILKFQQFIEWWLNKKNSPNETKITNRGDAEFMCWRFRRIPTSCIYWDSTKQNNLDSWM